MERMVAETPTLLVHSGCQLGENPLWHSEHQSLYWCDITAGRLYRHHVDNNRTEIVLDGQRNPEQMIGGFTIEQDGALLLFMSGGRVQRWIDGRVDVVLEAQSDMAATRFNDVIADPEGRVFCGTMPAGDKAGKLYRLDRDCALTAVVEGVGCSNGLGFTSDLKQLYYTDSSIRRIDAFAYDPSTGGLSNRTVFVDSKDQPGVPDGLTVDGDGNVWSARWEGACVTCHAPDGRELRRLRLPVSRVTSLTFGGNDLSTLFITSAQSEDVSTRGPNDGDVFVCRPGVAGRPEFRSRISS